MSVDFSHRLHCESSFEEDADLVVCSSCALPEVTTSVPRVAERDIGRNVASLIEDGATVQVGIGAIPDAVWSALSDRRDLGVHSGAVGDGIVALTEAGVITNSRKTIDRGITIAGVLLGSSRLHRFADRNAQLQLRPTDYTHNARVLASLDRFVAINSAIEVDLSGQVNSEVAEGIYVGAVGGVLDFLRGAHQSRGGVPIIALPSTTAAGRSRIVAMLSGPVTVPRSDAAFIVTEHGIVDLRGLSLSARRERLLTIAHPDRREALARETCIPPRGRSAVNATHAPHSH